MLTPSRLADSFGRAGFLTVAPDFFDGQPSPMDLNQPGFNQTQFLAEHGPESSDPIVEKGIQFLKKQPGVTKIVVRRPPSPSFSFPPPARTSRSGLGPHPQNPCDD